MLKSTGKPPFLFLCQLFQLYSTLGYIQDLLNNVNSALSYRLCKSIVASALFIYMQLSKMFLLHINTFVLKVDTIMQNRFGDQNMKGSFQQKSLMLVSLMANKNSLRAYIFTCNNNAQKTKLTFPQILITVIFIIVRMH